MIMRLPIFSVLLPIALMGCTSPKDDTANNQGGDVARFDWFDYAGQDEVFDLPLKEGEYRNPILAGYYPDPSVVAVGEDYYLINSTFAFYPGIPVFHSRDLVNWTQISNAIDRPDMMPFDGLHLGYNGVYAATIEHHEGTFYIINTCIGCGGNFVVTATDPSGPWSDPIWLPDLQGIDPSFLFDDDGRVYIVHQRSPDVIEYDGHSAIWGVEVDPHTFEPLSDDIMLLSGGYAPETQPKHIEGPHLYKIDGTYYLSAPEGGTGYYHQQMVYKSANPLGPFEGYSGNPILTQYGLPDDRPHPVTATGHADIFQDAAGDWWAVFLGTRPYDLDTPPQDPGRFMTGRETFLLPVSWKNGWPVILEKGETVPSVVPGPSLPRRAAPSRATTGNISYREEFDGEELGLQWLFVRTPHEQWWSIDEGHLDVQPRTDRVGAKKQPSFIGQRVMNSTATVKTKMIFVPGGPEEEAGLLAIQNSEHYVAYGLGQNAQGHSVVRVRRRQGADMAEAGEVLAEQAIDLAPGKPVYLRVDLRQGAISFFYSLDNSAYQPVLEGADASALTTAVAGGFTGAVLGVYAEK